MILLYDKTQVKKMLLYKKYKKVQICIKLKKQFCRKTQNIKLAAKHKNSVASKRKKNVHCESLREKTCTFKHQKRVVGSFNQTQMFLLINELFVYKKNK